MYVFFILLLLVLIAAGYYIYQRLLTVEREIRADQRALADEDDSPVLQTEIDSAVPEPRLNPEDEEGLAVGLGIKEQVELAVSATPGLAQTELYAKFPSTDRRELQKLLRELDASGQLRREKKGSSYRLYPA